MKTSNPARHSGFTLLEALIALLVVAFGVLGIAKLSGVMIAGTGLSKTRAEATQLAQEKIEELRNNITLAQYNAIADGEDTITGVNETFKRHWSICDAGGSDQRVKVKVFVFWPDKSSGAYPTFDETTSTACDTAVTETNKVAMQSVIAWNNMSTAAGLGTGNISGGGFVKTPTGRATVGTGETLSPGLGTDNGDGTRTYKDTSGSGTTYLIDSTTGKVLLSMPHKNYGDDDPTNDNDFSTISGRVYVEDGTKIANTASFTVAQVQANVFVLPSDASVCKLIFDAGGTALFNYPASGTTRYKYFKYTCYFGAEWWGNIGIARLDNTATGARVCLGDPTQTDSGNLNDRYPALNISRAFRGFKSLGGDQYDTIGIGIDEDTGAYDPVQLTGHDYLMTTINGNPSDADCKSHLELPSASENPFIPADANYPNTAGQLGNSGEFVCLTATCPDITVPSTQITTTIHGTITRSPDGSSNDNALTGLLTPNNCQSSSFTANGTTSYSYSCTINWAGFASNTWEDTLLSFGTQNGNATLCAADAWLAVVPDGSTVAYTINDKNAVSPNSLSFTDVQVGVTDITLNFEVKANACGTLGQAAPAWTGTDPKSLSWPSVAGATYYKVFTCTTTNTNDLSACTPSTLVANPTSPSYAPGSPGNKNTICVGVQATDGSLNGTISSTKCVYQKGANYTYQ